MSESPTKRRKTSPTTSFPINAPDTPSQIPVLRPQQDASKGRSRRPSFASPTRASLARHNPDLLKRPSSSGAGMEGTPVRRNLDDVFAKALEKARPSIEGNGNNTPKKTNTQVGEGIRGSRTLGGGLSAKPRRMSRSPVKSTKSVERVLDAPDLQGIVNPFVKKGGLRRSPIISSQAESTRQDSEPESTEQDINPFAKKPALRRSPVSSQVEPKSQESEVIRKTALRRSPVIGQSDAVGNSQPETQQEQAGPSRKTALRRSPVLSRALSQETEPVKRSGLRRSPVISQPIIAPEDSQPETIQQEELEPFKKTTLRRSPVAMLVENQIETSEPFGTTPPGPPPTRALQPAAMIHERAYKEAMMYNEAPKSSKVDRSSKVPATKETRFAEALKTVEASIAAKPIRAVGAPISEETKGLNQLDPFLLSKGTMAVERPQSKKHDPKEKAVSQTQSATLQKNKSSIRPPSSKATISEEIILPRHPDPPINNEPELPPTPTQLGLVDPIVTTPPVGIHNTPSKRARRNKALAGKIRSSPLKPRDDRPEEPKAGVGKEATPIPSLIPDSQVTNKSEKPKRRKSARFLVPVDPYAEKKKERDALLKQLQQLQADIAIGNQETERLRLLQEPRNKAVPAVTKASEELVAMLLRSKPTEPTEPKPQPTSIFKSIGAFLPFRSRRKQSASVLPIPEKPLPSLLPMQVEDPLPYLQAFTPLVYTSTINLLPTTPSSPNSATETSQLQHHLISASHPSGLFFSRISLTVNTSTFTTSSLEIIKLDPAAESELGTFIREQAEKKEITILFWAMGGWAELALKRAGFWCAVDAEFGTVEAREKSLQKLKGKRKRGQEEEIAQQGGWSRKQLLPQMSRTSFEVVSEELGVMLRVEWKMEFDWTGEVESEVSALAKVPGYWQQKDDRNSLTRIPETFRRLVKEKGPLGAVRTVVGLLMSDA